MISKVRLGVLSFYRRALDARSVLPHTPAESTAHAAHACRSGWRQGLHARRPVTGPCASLSLGFRV